MKSFNFFKKSLRKGFTLVELLVVVSLVGILATLVLANLNSARQRGRDAQRKSDLKNIATALRLYYNDYGTYPNSSSGKIMGCGVNGNTECSWGGAFTAGSNTYMSVLPNDPLSGQDYRYTYSDSENYTLEACLENESDDKGQAPADGTTWCSTAWEFKVQP